MSDKRYYVDVRIDARVWFDDNGEDDLNTQAVDTIDDALSSVWEEGVFEDNGIEIIGRAHRADRWATHIANSVHSPQ